jgi:Superinfection immunity protein
VESPMIGALGFAAYFLLMCYFLPAIVARCRAHRNTMAIFMLNLLLGWTLLGWVAALVWACTASQAYPQQRVATA